MNVSRPGRAESRTTLLVSVSIAGWVATERSGRRGSRERGMAPGTPHGIPGTLRCYFLAAPDADPTLALIDLAMV
jgi:hypothetical protein